MVYLACINQSDTFNLFHQQHTKEYDTFYTEEFEDLFTQMISVNPAERPTPEMILAHPWL